MAKPGRHRNLIINANDSRDRDQLKARVLYILNFLDRRSGFNIVYYATVEDHKNGDIIRAYSDDFLIEYGVPDINQYFKLGEINNFIGNTQTLQLIETAKQETLEEALQQAIDEIDDPALV